MTIGTTKPQRAIEITETTETIEETNTETETGMKIGTGTNTGVGGSTDTATKAVQMRETGPSITTGATKRANIAGEDRIVQIAVTNQ